MTIMIIYSTVQRLFVGAKFFITGDDKYLVKVISAKEFEMFVTNAHTYFG